MHTMPRSLVFAIAAACVVSGCGGSVSITLDGGGEREALAGSQVQIEGTFDTEGAYLGVYTMTTSPDDQMAACRVSVDGGGQETSLTVDTTDAPSRDLVVTVETLPTAEGFTSCQLAVVLDRDETVSASHAAIIRIAP